MISAQNKAAAAKPARPPFSVPSGAARTAHAGGTPPFAPARRNRTIALHCMRLGRSKCMHIA
ncbi:MAG: hypothetical protein DBY17_06100 [Oscillospiraceae bacterium]|nr:MAG: hypothetical protein DBY17_06100 [Oscillospiraceae bacterium]